MASNMTRVPLLRALARRGYAQAASKASDCTSDAKVEVSQLDNKLTVATVDNGSPVVCVSVSVKAGSRYEMPDNLGAANLLRSCAGLATKSFTKFAITRTLEESGASLTAVNDRDSIIYTLECLQDNLHRCLPILGSVVSEQVFKPWEVSDNRPRVEIELAQVPEQARLLDILHTAAYRKGLGNTIFIPKFRLSSLNNETLQHYVANTFSSNRAAVGVVGMHHSDASCFARNICLTPAAGSDNKAQYYGGEIRKPAAGPFAQVALAVEGSGLNNAKDALALTVLKHALGTGPRVPYGVNAGSSLAKAVQDASGCNLSAVSAINICHSDSGLFGVNLTCDASAAGKAVEGVVKVLRSLTVNDEMVARGKAGAKLALLSAGEKTTLLAEDISQQALLVGSVQTPQALAAAVDSLNSSDISNVARKVTSGKLSLAALGDLKCVPYLADLK